MSLHQASRSIRPARAPPDVLARPPLARGGVGREGHRQWVQGHRWAAEDRPERMGPVGAAGISVASGGRDIGGLWRTPGVIRDAGGTEEALEMRDTFKKSPRRAELRCRAAVEGTGQFKAEFRGSKGRLRCSLFLLAET